MPNEVEVKEVKEQEVEKKEENNPITTEEAPKNDENKVENASEKPIESEEKEEEKVEEKDENPVVEAEKSSGNGIRVEDLVTKDMLTERLSALESKMESLINENKGLTEKLTKMSEKYEDKDFGGFSKQGVQERNKYANDTFDEYAKQFM